MGNLCRQTPDHLRQTIRESNIESAKGNQKYVLWENEAIRTDYEFIACPCDENCWCKRHSCPGHYRIKKITFDQFLETYVKLWAPPRVRNNIKDAVLFGKTFNGRQRNAVPPLKELKSHWSNVLSNVRNYNKCGLCDSSFPDIEEIENLYQAKMWSQLYYDSIVPFDTGSKTKIKQAGYSNPIRYFRAMNKELFNDLRTLAENSSMNVNDIRNLDCPWDVDTDLKKPSGGQPLSRVLDKMFYTP